MNNVTKKTYRNFGEEIDILRIEKNLSYDRLSLAVGIPTSYIYYIVNRKVKTPPKNEIILKFANFFKVPPEYFFEYRVRLLNDHINKYPEDLDILEKALSEKDK